MHIDDRGTLNRFPMLDPIDGETFEERMRRSRQASDIAALEAAMQDREGELLNGDAAAQAAHRRDIARFQQLQARMSYRRAATGITGVGYHKRAKVVRSETAGKW